ncbi:carbohydrate ABC transporter permease [Treponema sp. HNW]|uniref:carbohydrate ABC transporter permease n=1 Tax=Treponema sp. HNW TaxID=3116654 RepID=UPI003D0FCEAD
MNNEHFKTCKNFFLILFFAFNLIVCAGPFLWMVSTSFKMPADQFSKALIPSPITLENYKRLFISTPYLFQQVFNSFEIAALTTLGQILTCGMAGFAFELFKFRGKKILFALLLATFIIPPQVTLIPNFIIFSKLHMVGSKLPLWITAFMGGAFGTFFMRQYFTSIPVELAEAARIDGAPLPFIFSRIYLPLAKPAISALSILIFSGSWNELIRALIYLPSDRKHTTLTVGLSLYQAEFSGQWSFLMACTVTSILPIFILFLFVQKQIIESAILTGLK